MRPTVLLFDVDGTLLTTVGVGRRALERALVRRYGSSSSLDGVRFDGMTDRAIVRTAVAAVAGPDAVNESVIDDILDDYVGFLADEVTRAPGLALHHGIAEALAAAASWERVAIGLGTGNIRPGARIKLERVGIFDRFAFGGFGCDHEDRAELLRIGARRGAARLGVPPETSRIVVIGDTPLDVAAAQKIGAECVAVGTSHYSTGELEAAGATAVFPDLAAQGALAALRGG